MHSLFLEGPAPNVPLIPIVVIEMSTVFREMMRIPNFVSHGAVVAVGVDVKCFANSGEVLLKVENELTKRSLGR